MLLLLYAFLADWQHVTTLRQSPLKCIPLMQGMANHMSMCRNKAQHTSLPPEQINACTGKNIEDSLTITLQSSQQIEGNFALRFKLNFPEHPHYPTVHPADQ